MRQALTFTAALLVCSHAWAECPAPSPQWREQILQQVNALRVSGGQCTGGRQVAGLAPVRWNPALETMAQVQASWLAEVDQLEHTGRSGENLAARARAANYGFAWVSENLAVGYAQPVDVLGAWRNSAKHCTNLLEQRAAEIALACSMARGGPLWVMTLGAAPQSAVVITPPPRQISPS